MVHVTTTAKNPLEMKHMAEVVFAYLRYNPFFAKNPNTSVWWKPIENLQLWKAATYLSVELPIVMTMNYHRLRGNNRKFQTF